jgi:hypothetical protein
MINASQQTKWSKNQQSKRMLFHEAQLCMSQFVAIDINKKGQRRD